MNKKTIITKSLAVLLSIVTLLNTVNLLLIYSKASYNSDNYALQGNREALGSPILNAGFQYDDWNKWEFIVWGIFLSNFTVPMVDDYESAFSSTATSGSKGAGYQALLFGAAADPMSRENLNSILKEAATLQKTGPTKRIWVSYSPLTDGVIDINDLSGQAGNNSSSEGETTDENKDTEAGGEVTADVAEKEEESDARPAGEDLTSLNGSGARIATIKDLFYTAIASNSPHGVTIPQDPDKTWVEAESTSAVGLWPNALFTSNGGIYPDLYGIRKANVPTFYIETHSGYTKVLDFTDPWDSMMVSSWISKAIMDTENSQEAVEAIGTLVNANLPIELDCFGNIVVQKDGNRVVFPAAANQHLTESPRRSLVNSLVLNGRSSSIPGLNYVLNGGVHNSNAGLAAFGGAGTGIPNGTTVVYYDTDSIIMRDALAAGGGKSGFKALLGKLPDSIHTGRAYLELFGMSLENAQFSTVPLKVEVVGVNKEIPSQWIVWWPGTEKFANTFKNTMNVAGQIPNQTLDHTSAPYLTYIKNIQGGANLELFNSGRIVSVQMKEGTSSGKLNVNGMNRLFMDWVNSAFNKESRQASGTVNKESITALLSTDKAKKYGDIWSQLMLHNGDTSKMQYSRTLVNFLVEHSEQYTLNKAPADVVGRDIGKEWFSLNNARDILRRDGKEHKVTNKIETSGDMGGYMVYGRLVKLFPGSNVAIEVNRVLGVRDGAQFATYSTAVYLTYLEWYGILDGINNKPRTSYLDTRIFEEGGEALNKNIEAMVNAMSEEDKKKSVLNNSYLLLHPELGREYRNNLIMTALTDWVYSTYMNIVYGKSTSLNANLSNQVNTRHASGFLSTPPYSENFMTSAFLKIYPRIAQWLLGATLIMIVVMGLLRRRKFSWFILTFVLAVNTILLIPAAGEITPYIANNIVQRMFTSKMTYWAISEGVENAKIEDRFLNKERNNVNYLSAGLSEQEKQLVMEVAKTFSVLNVDRSLAVRHDVSKKVTNTDLGNLSDVQRLSTARWMLPMIMRQFNAAAGNYDYVYIPLADINDNATNLYLYWNHEMAFNTDTASGAQVVTTVNESGEDTGGISNIPNAKVQDIYGRSRSHKGYIDIVRTSYIAPASEELDEAWDEPEQTFRAPIRSVYNADILSYTGFYMLTSEMVGQDFEVRSARKGDGYFDSEDAYQEYLNSLMSDAASVTAQYESINTFIEQNSSYYNMYDRGTMQGHFGYLWLTESNFPYFYLSIKDNTELYPSKHGALTLGRLIGTIQGRIGKDINGNKVRTDTWMHYKDTGYIRDFLDMEELFTNVIPYMYLSQVSTGGFGGDNGVLGKNMIQDYTIYKDNKASWLYRSNWVTKIMESPEYRKPDFIKDKDGNQYELLYPLEVSTYPDERPMVFSEAQMYEEGLTEADLCLVELKILEINREVAERWTLLLNYSGLSGQGLTKEVIQRQMALEATMAFNNAFSPNTLLSSERMLYPSGIDLRAISFDSVMKMVVLNVTRDSSFIYGDTMRTIINDSDIFTALLMLFAAFLCAYLIPLARTVVLGLLFYLTFAAMIGAIATSHKAKLRVSFGVLLTNLLFLLITLVYYATFALMTSLNSPDSVLNPELGSIQVGNPVWAFIAIIIMSLAYCFAMFKFMGFCFKNYKDMGMAAFQQFAMIAKETIGNGLQGLSSVSFGGNENNQINNTTNTDSIKGTGAGASGEGINSGGTFNYSDEQELADNPEEYGNSGYTFADENDPTGLYDEPSSIDSEIERGRQISTGYDFELERAKDLHRADILSGDIDTTYLISEDGRAIKTNLETRDADGNARASGAYRVSNKEYDHIANKSSDRQGIIE